jgi:organic radical activating enzyme
MMNLSHDKKRFHIEESVFYITNVCNLTCNNCETYNNRKFKGHFKWQDNQDDYYNWSRLVSFGLLNIHGGEPFTNPELLTWATELKKLWPNCKNYTVSSNGTLLKNNIELSRQIIDMGWTIDVTVHDPIQWNDIVEDSKNIVSSFNYDVNSDSKELRYIDKNTSRILISIIPEYYFYKSSNKYTRHGKIFMHRSDPNAAHRECISGSQDPCRFFVRGKLYKCPLTAISDDLIDQFAVEDEATSLLKKYKPATASMPIEELEDFFNNINNPISQCTLCPESHIRFPIYPLSNKKI